MIKPFLVFGGSDYYPVGGWDDFRGRFSTFDEAAHAARTSIKDIGWEWAHIINIETDERWDVTGREKRLKQKQAVL